MTASPHPRFIFLLSSAQRRLQQWMSAQQAQLGQAGEPSPTAAQGGVLFMLAKEDGQTMGQVATTLDLAPSAVSGLIQRMEAQGWVARHASPEDGRTQRVWLCPAGQALLPSLRQALSSINQRLTAGFTDSELQTVARWLTHVQALDLQTTDDPP